MARAVTNPLRAAARRCLRIAAVLIVSAGLPACSLGYYWQAMRGHMQLMSQREPVDAVLNDPQTPAATRRQLEVAQAALDFAHQDLRLPDNGSYRQYADTGRRYLVWNVVAAPEWSLQPRTWCFPVAGCVSYRGYFAESKARAFAAKRAAAGDDVFVGGTTAYSTLGRFADPLTNAILDMPDYQVAGLIFHELAHQQVYIAGDTAFNESFATAVEQAGIRRWLIQRGDAAGLCAYERWLDRRAAVREVLNRGRTRLAAIYAKGGSETSLHLAKAAALDALRDDYRRLRGTWQGPPDFDTWFGPTLNNASLAALSAYDEYVPAFTALLARNSADFAAFYAAVATLSEQPPAQRQAALTALNSATISAPPAPVNCPPAVAADSGISSG
jgi:predicted aminopeptidase